ncbi:MAG: penicillin-binding protein 2, partial [Alphaproteobacteria bacterium]
MEGSMAHRLALVRQRLVFLLVLFFAGFAVLALRTLSLASACDEGGRALADASSRLLAAAPEDASRAERAAIVDRAGRLLAVNLPVRSLYADPHRLRDDPARVAHRLSAVLTDVSEGLIRARLESGRRFVWIKRHLTPDEVWRVNALGIPGLAFKREEHRTYPQGRLAAHLVGFVDSDGRGLMGVERAFDERLRKPSPGSSGALRLSVDLRVQQALRDELRRAMAHFSALGAAGVVMDVNTGELLALVSLPDFDPDHAADAPTAARFNRVSQGVYELGSTFKTFTLAAALDAGVVRLDSRYDARKPIPVAGGYTIHDDHPKRRVLSVPEAYIYSSNIAFAKIALDLGLDRQRAFFERLGFFRPPVIELPERGRPLHPERWREVNAMTAAFGHGIAVTPLQLAAATAAMVNG